MSTLLRAWRVVCRARGRPWADGKDCTKGPIPSSTTHSSPLPESDITTFQMVGVNGFRHEHVRRHLGHPRGRETFAYLVELHVTPDIVAMPPGGGDGGGGGDCDALVNPANEALQGTRFDPTEANARFPNSGGRVYPEQTVDGAVTIAGGAAMYQACQAVREIPSTGSGVRCPVGAAVVTPAHGELRNAYRAVVHAVPPKHGDFEWERRLVQTYKSALDVAWGHGVSHRMGDGAHMHPDNKLPPMMTAAKTTTTSASANADSDSVDADVDGNSLLSLSSSSSPKKKPPTSSAVLGRVAMPLLGAGTRGVPLRAAARAAAEAVADYEPPQHLVDRVLSTRRGGGGRLFLPPGQEAPMLFGATYAIRFAVQDDVTAEELERALELHLGQCYVPLSTATGKYKLSKSRGLKSPPTTSTWTSWGGGGGGGVLAGGGGGGGGGAGYTKRKQSGGGGGGTQEKTTTRTESTTDD